MSRRITTGMSLVLLASSCLIVCIDLLPRNGASGSESGELLAALTRALDKSTAELIEREGDLFRISSGFCMHYPQKCRYDEFNSSECVSFGLDPATGRLACVPRSLFKPGESQQDLDDDDGKKEEEKDKARDGERTGDADDPRVVLATSQVVDLGNIGGNESWPASGQQQQQQLDDLVNWGELRLTRALADISGAQSSAGQRSNRILANSMSRPPDERVIRAKLPRSLKAARQLGDIERARQSQQQLSMSQYIMSALPGSFGTDFMRPEAARVGKNLARSGPLLDENDQEGALAMNRARSMRQHRSGNPGGPLLLVPKRTSAAEAEGNSEGGIGGGGGGGGGWARQRNTMRVSSSDLKALTSTSTSSRTTTTTSGHASIQDQEANATMQCNQRKFTFTATKRDEFGNNCSGLVTAIICYGGCDTGEIADWLFPGKRSIHKVCRHGERVRRRALLTACSSNLIGLDDPLREYHYVDARDCVCKRCTSIDTTCLGTMSLPRLQALGAASDYEPAPQAGAGGD